MEFETENSKDLEFWGRIRYCLKEVDFVICMLSITSLFVVITGV